MNPCTLHLKLEAKDCPENETVMATRRPDTQEEEAVRNLIRFSDESGCVPSNKKMKLIYIGSSSSSTGWETTDNIYLTDSALTKNVYCTDNDDVFVADLTCSEFYIASSKRIVLLDDASPSSSISTIFDASD